MRNRDKKEQEEQEYQQQLYDRSSKRELWDNMKAGGHSTIYASYIAGCAVATNFLPDFSLRFNFLGILILYPLLLIEGAAVGAIILSVVMLLTRLPGPTIPRKQNVIMALLTPFAIIILCTALGSMVGE